MAIKFEKNVFPEGVYYNVSDTEDANFCGGIITQESTNVWLYDHGGFDNLLDADFFRAVANKLDELNTGVKKSHFTLADEVKQLKKENRALSKHLNAMANLVLSFIAHMDATFSKDKTISQDVSQKLGKLTGSMELKSDLIRNAVGLSIDEAGKAKCLKASRIGWGKNDIT